MYSLTNEKKLVTIVENIINSYNKIYNYWKSIQMECLLADDQSLKDDISNLDEIGTIVLEISLPMLAHYQTYKAQSGMSLHEILVKKDFDKFLLKENFTRKLCMKLKFVSQRIEKSSSTQGDSTFYKGLVDLETSLTSMIKAIISLGVFFKQTQTDSATSTPILMIGSQSASFMNSKVTAPYGGTNTSSADSSSQLKK